MRLNLGCAHNLLEGYVNVDIVPGEGITVVDLRDPWPWRNCTVDTINASHIIEHLPDKIHTMNELWRVLKPEGRALIAVPTTDGPAAWQDPTHVSYWNRRSFCYYEHQNPYREQYARSYGIQAAFRVVDDIETYTIDGPILHIVLVAVKDKE